MLVAFTSFADAQIIGSTNNATSPKVDYNNLYRPTGPSLQFEAGYLGGAVGLGYQLNPYIMVGSGGTWLLTEGLSTIFYLESRFSTPLYNHSIFLDLKGGLDFSYGYAIPVGVAKAGYMYKNLSLGVGLFLHRYIQHVDTVYGRIDIDRYEPSLIVQVGYNLPLNGLMRHLF